MVGERLSNVKLMIYTNILQDFGAEMPIAPAPWDDIFEKIGDAYPEEDHTDSTDYSKFEVSPRDREKEVPHSDPLLVAPSAPLLPHLRATLHAPLVPHLAPPSQTPLDTAPLAPLDAAPLAPLDIPAEGFPLAEGLPSESDLAPLEEQDELPNCIRVNRRFKLQQNPPEFVNWLLERIKTQQIPLKLITNDELEHLPYRPLWGRQDRRRFWTLVIHQALVLELYFRYFLNLGLNILLRGADLAVNGVSTPSSPMSPDVGFTSADIPILEHKQLIAFGRLVKSLRYLLLAYHPEYPSKMLLLSMWVLYIDMSADCRRLCLMAQGTLQLLHSSLHTGSASPAMLQEMLFINSHVLAAYQPDYNFELIVGLARQYGAYCAILATMPDPGVLPGRRARFGHDVRELGRFFRRLEEHYHPEIVKINETCQRQRGIPATHLRFVLPLLLFRMMREWFCVYLGLAVTQLQLEYIVARCLALFFHATALALGQVYTPLRSVMLVDPCAVAAATTDADLGSAPDPKSDFGAVAVGLMRTIRLLELRQQVFSYQLLLRPALDQPVALGVDSALVPSEWRHRDIVEVLTPKMAVRETQLLRPTREVLSEEHFPVFPADLVDAEYCALRRAEHSRLHAARAHPCAFDAVSSLLLWDFDARGLADHVQRQAVKMYPDSAAMQQQLVNFLNARMAISKAVEEGWVEEE